MGRRAVAIGAVVVAVAAAIAGATTIAKARADAPAPAATKAPAIRHAHRSTAFYLSTTQAGLADVREHWWDADAGWYYDTYNRQPPTMPLARLWSAYPLFETFIAMAEAKPTRANKAALKTFANDAARLYWNPNVKPYGGYGWYPHQRAAGAEIYFDDSGWWGLSFVGAYQATGDKAFLADARRAFRFIVGSGWDPKYGGTWWETRHDHKTIEPLAAAVLIGTRLYEAQHRKADLRWVLKLLNWADAHSFNEEAGLYQRNASDGTVMDYAQGLMITATWELCKTLHRAALCTKARTLANAAWKAFPRDLDWAPEYDVVYLRWMLDYGRESGDRRWYRLAADNAERALAARNESGFYLNNWEGKPLSDSLMLEAANLELFGWLAARAPRATAAGR